MVRAPKQEFEWENESKMRYKKKENQKIGDAKESERRLGGGDTEEVERGATQEDGEERESSKRPI